jgi:YD repeat-containing protein
LERATDDLRARARVNELLKTDARFVGTPLGAAIGGLLKYQPADAMEHLGVVTEWLSVHPRDAYALRFQAYQLANLERHREAADAFAASAAALPFRMNSLRTEWARALLQQGLPAAARGIVETVVRRFFSRASNLESLIEVRWAQALSAFGEKGQARSVLETVSKSSPAVPQLLDALASLELDSGRPAEALRYARQAVEHTVDADYVVHLMQALTRSGRAAEVLPVFQQLPASVLQPAIYLEVGRSLGARGRTSDQIAMVREGLAKFPESAWLQRELADALGTAGRTTEAIAVLEKSFDVYPPYLWSVRKLIAWSGSRATASLERLRLRFPWIDALWEPGETAPKLSLEQKVVLLRRAIAANPDRDWPWEHLTDVWLDAERWAEAEATAQQAFTAAVSAPGRDQLSARLRLARVALIRSMHEAVPAAALDAALAHLETYRSEGGLPTQYHQNRARALRALGRTREANIEGLRASELDPDNGDLLTGLFEAENDGFEHRIFRRLNHHIARNPYDADRLGHGALRHIMYGGNPVHGLQLLAHLKERHPDEYREREWLEANAYGQLGDHEQQFRREYAAATRLSNSDRYIGWYESARLRAQNVPSASVTPDFEKGLVTIRHPSGEETIRQYDPVTGRLLLYQVGAAYVRGEYHPLTGHLTRVFDSGGNQAQLTYDDADRIASITSGSTRVDMTYGALDKPERIAVRDLGEITVRYTSDGAIDRVDSTGGAGVAGRVARVFDELTTLVQSFEDCACRGFPNELPYRDPTLEELRERQDLDDAIATFAPSPRHDEVAAASRIQLGRYLLAHLSDRRSYAQDVRDLLAPLVAQARDSSSIELQRQGLDAVEILHELAARTRKQGLPPDEWTAWSNTVRWVEGLGSSASLQPRLAEVSKILAARPLELYREANWLPRSHFDSPGFWRRFPAADVLPAGARGTPTLNAVLVRANHHVVVGTSAGLALLRRGYWEWFGFDEGTSAWSRTMSPAAVSASSEVLSLVETADDAIWIGTAAGLHRLPAGEDPGASQRWTAADGLASNRVVALAAAGSAVYAAGDGGLRKIDPDGTITRIADVPDVAVIALRAAAPSDDATAVLASTRAGVFAIAPAGVTRVSDLPATSAIWRRSDQSVFLLSDSELYRVPWNWRDPPGAASYVRDQQNIARTSRIAGVELVSVEDRDDAVVALTDKGLSFYFEDHFESKALPFTDRLAAVTAVAERDGRLYAVSPEGVFAVERGQAMSDTKGRVFDLLAADDLELTFVARGSALEVVDHKDLSAGARLFDVVEATHLARDADGRLVTNDGLAIVRYERGSTRGQQLFEIPAQAPNGMSVGPLRSLIVASDGTIWAAAGPFVYRWRDGSLQQFSIFKTPAQFPARSDMISRIVETIDRRIQVVASSEGHRQYRGLVLSGGLLEWTGTEFRRIDISKRPDWFMTSYTPITADTAIVGTVGGFVRVFRNDYQGFASLGDSSYLALRKRTPMLWSGSRGARLGDDTWLFGSAGGVVAYRNGIWFYPDRLNWMVPDDYRFASSFGVRTVHAVSTTTGGHIMVGTDRGLLVYDSGGGDAASFLVSNQFGAQAFAALEEAKLKREADVFLSRTSGRAGQQAAEVRRSREVIEQLETRLQAPPSAANPTAADPAASERLRTELASRQRAHTQLLFQLQRENPGLYRMVDFKPLELAKLRSQLRPDEAVLQYLPTPRSLYIHVVTQSGAQIREVQVEQQELFRRSDLVSRVLAGLPAAAVPEAAARPDRGVRPPPVGMSDADLTAELSWLYDHLIRPAERDLERHPDLRHIYIVPVDRLTYLPFAALVRASVPRIEYAVERFSFGYLTSLWLFDLIQGQARDASRDALVMGDPDGSLPGARAEASTVHGLLGGGIDVQLGSDASYESLMKFSSRARVVHLATHGFLNPETPEMSYLLLANNARFSVVDAVDLPLKDVALVVLSACETAQGRSGLEYSTLAAAFIMAGTPTVVATLWRVQDDASRELMEAFYGNVAGGASYFAALARAQRAMLAGPADRRHPRAWAGYIPYGRPF